MSFVVRDVIRTSVSLTSAALLVFVFASVSLGQGGVGSTRGLPESSGGSNMLEGKVRLPNGRTAGLGIVVRLEGITVGSRSATTDQDGNFAFRSLPSGEYTLSVDGGSDYQSIRQLIVIQGTAGGAREGNSAQVVAADLHFFPKRHDDNQPVFPGVLQAAVESYKKGMEAAREGNSKKAVDFFKSAITLDPKFSQAFNALGVQYLKLGEMAKLQETMELLLDLTPNDAHAHLNLGIALYNQKKLPDADIHLRKAVESAPDDPAAHYYLGMTLIASRNRYDEAEKELELAIKNGGDNLPLAHRYLGGLYMNSKKNEQAAKELEKYLKLDPKAPDAERIKGTIADLRKKH